MNINHLKYPKNSLTNEMDFDTKRDKLFRRERNMNAKEAILNCLDENVDMPTAEIVEKLQVSPRHVQRIRKEYKEAMDNNDVFDTGMNDDTEVNDANMLSDFDIEILNMANEGGWSVQQMAENTRFTLAFIRKTLTRLKHMVKADVLDEADKDVYFKGSATTVITDGTQSILDELDAIPGVEGINVSTRSNEEFWEIEQDCVTACSKVEKSVDVFMNVASRRKAMLYMKWAGAREWLAYLVGKFENGKYIIEDLYLPDQRTSSALVDKVDTTAFNQMPIVGVIHSHHEMGAGEADRPSFSGHDAAFINSNHNLSLLAGRDGAGFKIVGIARTKTPCGAFIQIKANVKALVENPDSDKALRDEFLEKTMTQQTQPYVYKKCNKKNEVVVNDKRVLYAGPDGVVHTRGKGFHFTN